MVYEGKAKILYEGPEPGTLIQYFKDDATAFNAQKKDVIDGKGVLNNRISEHIMTALTGIGVPNHFIRRINMREQLIRACEIVPLEVIVRNVAAGSLSKRLGIEEGTPLPRPIIEFCYKDDALGDPLVTEEHIIAFNWASQQDIDDIIALALRVNDFLSGLFTGVGIKLVDLAISSASSWPTRSARTAAGCGTSRPARSWTRTCSAAISAACPTPIPRWRGGWESCPKAVTESGPGPNWCIEAVLFRFGWLSGVPSVLAALFFCGGIGLATGFGMTRLFHCPARPAAL
jgi:phosphoribosylaminoimidazole-succinocarboxamide synthase